MYRNYSGKWMYLCSDVVIIKGFYNGGKFRMVASLDVDYIVDYFHFGEVKGSSITLNYSYEMNAEIIFESTTNILNSTFSIDIYNIPR